MKRGEKDYGAYRTQLKKKIFALWLFQKEKRKRRGEKAYLKQ